MLFLRWLFLSVLCLWCLVGSACRKGAPDLQSAPENKQPVWNMIEQPAADLSGLDPSVQRQMAKARKRVTDLQEMEPVDPLAVSGAFGYLGMLYETYSFHEAAEACFNIARELDPKNFKWVYLLGLSHRSQGRLDLALKDFDKALELNSRYLPARVATAEARLSLGRNDEAREIFEAVLRADPNNPPALAGLGKLAYAAKDWPAAIAAYEKVLEIQPEADALYYSLGLAYRGAGDRDRARECLEMRGKQDPFMRDPVAAEMSGLRVGTRSHEHRGVDAGKLGNLDLAMAELEKAVNLDPENTSARTNLGTAYALAGRLDDAMEQYQAAVALDPEDRRAQCNFGVILAKLGRNEEARIRFGEALKLDSDYCDAHVGFAAVSAILGDYAEAEEHFRMAWDMDPENRAAILGLAKALSKQGRDKDALDVLMRGRQVHPQSLILANALARLQSASAEESVRDGASALRLADAVVKVNPSPEHMETLAMALAESGNFVDAARIQERAVEMWKESSSREGGEGVDEERGEGLDGARIRLEKYQKSEFCRDPAFRFEQFDGAIEPGKQ